MRRSKGRSQLLVCRGLGDWPMTRPWCLCCRCCWHVVPHPYRQRCSTPAVRHNRGVHLAAPKRHNGAPGRSARVAPPCHGVKAALTASSRPARVGVKLSQQYARIMHPDGGRCLRQRRPQVLHMAQGKGRAVLVSGHPQQATKNMLAARWRCMDLCCLNGGHQTSYGLPALPSCVRHYARQPYILTLHQLFQVV